MKLTIELVQKEPLDIIVNNGGDTSTTRHYVKPSEKSDENKRTKKSIIFDIMELALETKQHDVFVNYYPHTNSLEIQVYPGKWKTSKVGTPDTSKHFQIYVDKSSVDKLERFLDKLRNYVSTCGENNEI